MPRKARLPRTMHPARPKAMILDMKTCGRERCSVWRAVAASLLLGGCASVRPDRSQSATYRPSMSPAQEAAAIAAAKRHPIAQPEPRSLYPEEAPPPLPADEQAAPWATASRPPPPNDGELPNESGTPLVAPSAPPSHYADAPSTTAPADDYVWAPGYWSWSGTNYYWVAGDWLAPRPGYFYLGTHWYDRGYGWEMRPGGWARRGSGIVSYPVYRAPSHGYQPHPWPNYYRSNRENPGGPAWGRSSYGGRAGSAPYYPAYPATRSTPSYQTARSAPHEVDNATSAGSRAPSSIGRYSGGSAGGGGRIVVHRR
jgi:hypothetical protein